MEPTTNLLSAATWARLLRVFTRRGLEFFKLYQDLYDLTQGMFPEEGNIPDRFRQAVRITHRMLVTDSAKNQFAEQTSQLRPMMLRLHSLLREGTFPPEASTLLRRIVLIYTDLIPIVAMDRDVFLRGRVLSGRIPWVVFRVMSKKEQQTEKLRKEDPALYQTVQESKETFRKLDESVQKSIREFGLEPRKFPLMGRLENVGQDPVTGERFVFTLGGDLKPIDEYIQERRSEERSARNLNRVFPLDLDGLRSFSGEEVDEFATGQVRYTALTDDKVKQRDKAVTRVYPVREIDGKDVVVDGRFKGFLVEDLVNRAGRLIEGTAFDYDTRTNRPVPLENTLPDGSVSIRVTREPYVTVTPDGKLLLSIPRTKASKKGVGYTPQRNAAYELSKLVPSVEGIPKTGRSQYYFEPKDFAAIRDALGSMALSTAAMNHIREHFVQLAKHELATSEENLRHYQTDAIGGFKDGQSLYRKQREAMAWVESRGGSGVCALDTGVGKCVVGNTLITTDKGLVPIQDLNPGNTEPDTSVETQGVSVLVGGEALPIKSFYYGGVKPTIKVRTRRGYAVEGSRQHPLLVRTPDGHESWIQTPDLAFGDYLCVERAEAPFPARDPLLSVPTLEEFKQPSRNPEVQFTNGNVNEFDVPRQMTPDLGRLLGYLVAEGWTNSRFRFAVSQCPTRNPQVRADIEALLRMLGWDPQPEKDIQVNSAFLREYLFRMGLGMGVAKDKCIPEVILRSSRETVRHFIRALVDAEGSVQGKGRGHIEFSTASERLGRELQVLLLRFGVVCSRRPKRVQGYDHTYWRITISGQDAALYQERIGFVSRRKSLAATELPTNRNSNLDVVPHLAHAVGTLFDAVLAALDMNVSAFRQDVRSGFDCAVTHVRRGRRNPTYAFLKDLLSLAADAGCREHDSFKVIEAVVARNFFYDPIETLEESKAVVMDIEVDDPRHLFIGNGLVNHNTSLAVGMIQKMRRDGKLEGGKKVLYVCPPKLRGNLPREARKFLDNPEGFMEAVDVMSYPQLLNALRKDPQFADGYAAIIFDEGHFLKDPRSKTTRAVMGIRNPNKVLMTASPMTRSPVEVFTLAAVANNESLDTPEERVAFNARLRAFRKRFASEIGGRIVGIKSDPVVAKDFRVWVKQNLYFADKTDVEEIELPALRKQTMVLTMDPEVEARYREATEGISDVLRGMAAKFKLRAPDADDRIIESARFKLKALFNDLFRLASMPETVVPGARNPKLEQAEDLVESKVGTSGRTVLFTDSPDLAELTVKRMSFRFPGKLHAVGLADSIQVWQDGEMIKLYRPRIYKDLSGTKHPKSEWQSVILNNIVGPNDEILTLTLTKSYALGQNLQMFGSVIHLDRDDWNSETMKQRTARVWRNGQQNSVDETILDAVYENPVDERDETLDRIVAYLQDLEGELFERVVIESQTEALGSEFFGMKRLPSSFISINRKMLELSLSPYLARSGAEDL